MSKGTEKLSKISFQLFALARILAANKILLGFPALAAVAGAGALVIFAGSIAAIIIYVRRRRIRLRKEQPLLADVSVLSEPDLANDGDMCAETIVRKEIASWLRSNMAAKKLNKKPRGGTVIIPKTRVSEDSLLRTIAERAHVVGEPLSEGFLMQIFDTTQEGHDCAVIVEVVGRDQPWVHSR